MTKKRRILVGSFAIVVLAAFLLFGPLGQGAWVEPPELLRNAKVIHDQSRITRTAAGMSSGVPVRLAIRHRIYQFDRPSQEILARMKRELPPLQWTRARAEGQQPRQSAALFLLNGTPPPDKIHVMVWETPGIPTTRVDFQELRQATTMEIVVDYVRRLMPRR